jgi:exosortase E/protease (VPEID-CTERM system)
VILASWLAWTTPLRELAASPQDNRTLLFLISPAVWLAFATASAWLLFPPATIAPALTLRGATVFAVPFAAMFAYFYSGLALGKDQAHALIMLTMSIATPIYGLSGGTVTFDGYDANGQHVFTADTFSISMAPSCAGTQGMTLATLAALLFVVLEYRRLRLARVLLLVPLFAGLTFLINAVRIAVLLHIGESWSPEIAVNGFHSNFGVVSLALVSVLFVAVVQFVPVFRQTQAEARAGDRATPDTATIQFVAPLAVLIGVSLVTGVFSGLFYWLYPVHAAAGAVAVYRARNVFRRDFKDVSVLAVAVGVITFMLWIAMVPHDDGQSADFAEALYAAPTWLAAIWLLFRVIGSVVVVPIAEELAFRGFMQYFLAKTVAPHAGAHAASGVAILATGIGFALVHASVAAAFVAGIAYGLVYSYRNRLGDAIVAHAITNLLIAIYVLMLERWSYW